MTSSAPAPVPTTMFPILYKRIKNGSDAINSWQITVEGPTFYTVEGQVGGKLTRSEPTVCTPKNVGRSNHRTAEAQAVAEATSKHAKKLTLGYTTDPTCAPIATSASFVEPMLAKNWSDLTAKMHQSHVKGKPIYSQPKLDGVRAIATPSGLFSRNGLALTPSAELVAHVRDVCQTTGLVLDGELYSNHLSDDFSRLVGLVRGGGAVGGEIKYHVYDLVATDGATFSTRLAKLREVQHLFNPQLVEVVRTDELVGGDDARMNQLEEDYLAAGYEGQMIRLDAPYQNKRTWNLMKRKRFDDAEYRIVDVLEGVGGRVGTVGACVMESGSVPPVRFKSNVRGSHEALEEAWRDRAQLVGRVVNVRYFGLTPDRGVPRFPYISSLVDQKDRIDRGEE